MALRQMSSTELDRSAINIEQIEGLHFVCMLIQPVSVEQIIWISTALATAHCLERDFDVRHATWQMVEKFVGKI